MTTRFSTIEAAVAAIHRGEVVIVVDAEDRENEGDFVCAADKATPAIVNFMITHGRGQVCMSILPDVARRLDLPLMVAANSAPLGTAFTVPVDHRSVKTGITAAERAATIAAILDPASVPSDFTRPGHLFPLVAKEGGVLRRAGHTEAAVDLARLADLPPAGVLCEILDDTGNRADRARLFAIAAEHRMEIISIEELIRYRRVREKLVERIAEALTSSFGQRESGIGDAIIGIERSGLPERLPRTPRVLGGIALEEPPADEVLRVRLRVRGTPARGRGCRRKRRLQRGDDRAGEAEPALAEHDRGVADVGPRQDVIFSSRRNRGRTIWSITRLNLPMAVHR